VVTVRHNNKRNQAIGVPRRFSSQWLHDVMGTPEEADLLGEKFVDEDRFITILNPNK
jgi:hypothetical protein